MVTSYKGNRRPRTVVESDTSQLGVAVNSSKVLALVGDFPYLQPFTPTTVDTQGEMLGKAPNNAELKRRTHFLFNPAPAAEMTAKPGSIVLCNVRNSTAALRTVADLYGNGALTLTAKRYGITGKAAKYLIQSGTQKGLKYTLTEPGFSTETYDNVGGDNVLTFNYTGSDATTMLISFDLANLRISYTQSGIALGTFAAPDYPFMGTISITPSGSGNYTAVITGIDDAGDSATETITWTASGAQQTSTNSYVSVTSIVFTETSGSVNPTWTIAGYSFDLDVTASAYDIASELTDVVGADSGFTTTTDHVRVSEIPSAELDALKGKWLMYDAQTANFTVGKTVTGGTSGATAYILGDTDGGSTGVLRLTNIVGTFQDNEAITDDNSTPGAAVVNGTPGDWYVAFDGQSSDYVAGETVTVTGGSAAVGVVRGIVDAGATGTLVIERTSGSVPLNNEALVGSLGGDGDASADGSDASQNISCKGVAVPVQANLWQAIQDLTASNIVTPTRASGGNHTPGPVSVATPLLGGTEPTITNANWTSAFTALRTERTIRSMWIDSTDATIHALADAHCTYMAGDGGGYTPDFWCAPAASETEDALWTRTKNLGGRNANLVIQQIERDDYDGATVTIAPKYVALIGAGQAAALEFGQALTHRYVTASDAFTNSAFDVNEAANRLLGKGMKFLTKYDGRWRWERDITTYQKGTAARTYGERSANEAFNESCRRIAIIIDTVIGDEAIPATEATIKRLVKDDMREQADSTSAVAPRLLKSFNPATVSTTLTGDVLVVNTQPNVVEPINFAINRANVAA